VQWVALLTSLGSRVLPVRRACFHTPAMQQHVACSCIGVLSQRGAASTRMRCYSQLLQPRASSARL
jgi:hypothetical protein